MASVNAMIFDLLETIVDGVVDLFDGPDSAEGLSSDTIPDGSGPYEQPMSPLTSEVQSTLEANDIMNQDLNGALEFEGPDSAEVVNSDMVAEASIPSVQPLSPLSSEVQSTLEANGYWNPEFSGGLNEMLNDTRVEMAEMQSTLEAAGIENQDLNGAVDGMITDTRADLAAMKTMSPEELEAFTAESQAQTAALGAQIGAIDAVNNITESVNESETKLAESWAKSFDPGRYTPFEDGITLEHSNVPHNISEFEEHSYGILERDGKFYEESSDGVHREISVEEADL